MTDAVFGELVANGSEAGRQIVRAQRFSAGGENRLANALRQDEVLEWRDELVPHHRAVARTDSHPTAAMVPGTSGRAVASVRRKTVAMGAHLKSESRLRSRAAV
jgi:hypothetical protein